MTKIKNKKIIEQKLANILYKAAADKLKSCSNRSRPKRRRTRATKYKDDSEDSEHETDDDSTDDSYDDSESLGDEDTSDGDSDTDDYSDTDDDDYDSEYSGDSSITESDCTDTSSSSSSISDAELNTTIEQDTIILNALVAQKSSFSPENKTIFKCIDMCKKEISSNIALRTKRLKITKVSNRKKFSDILYGSSLSSFDTFKHFNKLSIDEQTTLINSLKNVQEVSSDEKPYKIKILQSSLPDNFKKIILNKIIILDQMEPTSGEHGKLKNWIDHFMRIPFDTCCDLPVTMEDGIDKCHDFIVSAKQILDDTVYGLDDIKMQLVQVVGQLITNSETPLPSISIYGPPGTGKTSLVKDGLSKILNRPFAFIALGGASDGSFLDGHSYTFEGSIYGKIMQIIIDCKCMNPIIYFDELDKINSLPKGDEIVGVLMHLIDASQNSQFHDKYFSEFDFDLSKCLFIFSYNDEQKVNYILRDRMYKIQTTGYNKSEKNVICSKHLIPKIETKVNFSHSDISFSSETIDHIITTYCDNETGVRNLNRCVENIYTKLNLFRLIKPGSEILDQFTSGVHVDFPLVVTTQIVDSLLTNKAGALTNLITNKNSINELSIFNQLGARKQTETISNFKDLYKNGNAALQNSPGSENRSSADMSFLVNIVNSDLSTHNKEIAMERVKIMNCYEKQEHNYSLYMSFKKWINMFSKIPFGKYSPIPCTLINNNNGDDRCRDFITKCKFHIDRKIHGMSNTKGKMVEFIAQLISVHHPKFYIGLKGPSGSGKKLIVQTLAELIDRPMEVISLHGITDEHMLDGRSMTFEGSICGQIVNAFIKHGTMNPIIYFDGIDKIPARYASTAVQTLMMLTGERNQSYRGDKYFSDIEFDVSKCIFIVGYENDNGGMPNEIQINPEFNLEILKGRFYRILDTSAQNLNHKDKLCIFREFLLPKFIAEFGMADVDISISDQAVYYILDQYCKADLGINTLIHHIETIFSKINVCRLEKTTNEPVVVDQSLISDMIPETLNQTISSMYI